MEALRALIETERFEHFITGLIIVNAIALGLETSDTIMASYGPLLRAIDIIVLTIFVVEISARIVVHGRDFWRSGWSLFDFAVVAVALIPATGNLSVLRAFRIIRVLRLVSAFPSMQRVVKGLIEAIPGMGAIVMLLLLILYVSAVMATQLFGDEFPQFFGTLGASSFSLFQIMTLEGWPDIARQVLVVFPWAWIFFVVYILVTSFAVLNLFIGIIVDAMQYTSAEETAGGLSEQASGTAKSDMASLLSQISQIRADIAELKNRPGS